MRVAFVRGAHLNEFEAQNYVFDDSMIDLRGIGSMITISTHLPFEIIRFPSVADIGNLPYLPFRRLTQKMIKYISNRTLGDSQILFNLESIAGNFDIFHTADPHYYYSYQLAKLRAKNRIKNLIMTSWETIPSNNETVEQKRLLKKFVLRHADRAICHTEKAASVLVSEGFPENSINIIKLGVDMKRFNAAAHDDTVPHLLFVGRLVEEKGIIDTIDAIIRAMNTLTVKFDFQIVGSGPLEYRVIKKIKDSGLSHRIILSKYNYTDIHKVYKQCDILIAPSKKTTFWEEQYGMVFPEAMASGLAVIASDTGAIREVVGDGALMLKTVSSESITSAIIKLVSNKKYLEKLKKYSLERAAGYFDSSKVACEIGKIYSDLWIKSK